MLFDLVGEQIRDVTRADDDDILDVRALAATNRAARGTQKRDERDGEQPEDDESGQIRIREIEDVRDDEEAPRPQRDDLEDSHNVVDRGVIGALLVTVI